MARSGRLQSQLQDSALRKMLEQISQGEESESSVKVQFDRRRYADESDSDLDLSDL